MSEINDLTVVYYTANVIPYAFDYYLKTELLKAIGNTPLISVSQKPMEFGHNICLGDIGWNHLNIYKQALIGVKAVKTKYVALAEDDILYSKEHFEFRPPEGVFGYNKSVWSLYTWSDPPVYSWKDRRNLYSLICERDLFISAMEERFIKYQEAKQKELGMDYFVKYWAEPGKYENFLGVTKRKTVDYYSEPSIVAFSHETALSYGGLGKRKKLGHLRAFEIPYWGRASDIIKIYG